MLVPQVRSARRHLLTPGTHRMFKHYSVCSGSIWKRLCARNTTDLVVKGWKSKYKFAVSLFSVFIFSFPSLLKIQVEDKGKDFHIARKLFKSTFIFWYKSLVFRCVPSRKLIAARIIFVISVIFKFTKIKSMKKFWNFFTDIAALHVWLAFHCNSNSKINLKKLLKIFYRLKRGNVVFTLFTC